ncbi:MAG: hypothetical protein B7Y45_06365 [Sphingomonas sp. 28-66-16]|nr:MAG: hypothetical protein B7Y45_06365 [Sphingomonas sp. 28-66-16]
METLDRQTETTSSRIAALAHLHAKYDCLNTILWLTDRSNGREQLLSSYQVGDPNIHEALVGAVVDIPRRGSKGDLADVLERVQSKIAHAVTATQRVTPIVLYPTIRAPTQSVSDPSILGVIVLHRDVEIGDPEAEEIASHISNIVEFTRLNRLATCVTNAQAFLSRTSKDVPKFLNEIGFFMLSQLNSSRCMYVNVNRAQDWLEIEGDHLEQLGIRAAHRDFAIEECGVAAPGEVRQVGLKFQECGSSEPAILVPLPQAGYAVRPVPFAKHNDFYRSLPRQNADDIKIIFFEKVVAGYLQNRFSEADVAIANAIFGFVGKYIESIIFESNTNEVISHLDTEDMVQDDADSILKILSGITRKFNSVTILRVGGFERSIYFDKVSATHRMPGLEDYLKKVRTTYFQKYYESRAGNGNNNHPYFGVDGIDGRTVIEVHFPRYSSESRLYLVELDGEVISESALRSLISLFSDLYSRVMREENIRERGSYLMQVRHAVIHHFSAANRSLKSIRPLWERGQRDKDYWLDLLNDPLIGSDLARTISSLGQASLIIENGRFMIGELESSALNRKPYRIAELINSTLDVLKYNRDDKRIGVISKISGPPPKSMRGDGPLLSIALMNLFDNAIKYSPHFAKIRWRLDYLPDRYRLSISSVGDKLDPNARMMLFQEGYRGFQSDRLNRRHGTGLGLPVAYRILKAHSPTAQLSFEPFDFDAELEGAGNTFFFEMPFFSGSSARAAAEADVRD